MIESFLDLHLIPAARNLLLFNARVGSYEEVIEQLMTVGRTECRGSACVHHRAEPHGLSTRRLHNSHQAQDPA